jgi:hypothetical protein
LMVPTPQCASASWWRFLPDVFFFSPLQLAIIAVHYYSKVFPVWFDFLI